ncbi:MAG TPA: VOC family protein, partial [Steroidobacteraceae bacterium]|nr:VOC family protein [Steroidobacteraceae bacterium]
MPHLKKAALTAAASCLLACLAGPVTAQEHTDMASNIGAAKLIIGDVKQNQTYFEQMFGMKEVNHYRSKDLYDEPIMGFEEGARLALFSPLADAPLKKSQYPVALLYTPDLDGVVKRLQDANYPVRRLDAANAGTVQIAIARDPSGNAIELVARPGKWEVGGSKLIVNDRQKAEDFFVKVFGLSVGRRFQTPAYDEVVMSFGSGAVLALFQPLSEAPLPKSQYPVVAI